MYTCLEPCFLKACCIVHLMWNAHTVSSHSCYTCLDPIVLEVCVTMAWSRILPWAFIAWLQVAEVNLRVAFSERQFLSIGLVSQSLAICKLRSERQKVRLFLLAWNLFSTWLVYGCELFSSLKLQRRWSCEVCREWRQLGVKCTCFKWDCVSVKLVISWSDLALNSWMFSEMLVCCCWCFRKSTQSSLSMHLS